MISKFLSILFIGGVCLNFKSLFKLRHQFVVIIKNEEIIKSHILMMKPIDKCLSNICLSDAGLTSIRRGKLIKVGGIRWARVNMSENWTRAKGSVDVSVEGFGP